MILNYKQFLLEKYTINTEDPPYIINIKNSLNKDDEDIKNFNSYKNNLLNIYLNYTDHNDLISKLKSNKYTDKEGNFNNSLLGHWAKYCSKERKKKDLESDIKKLEDEKSGLENGSDSIKDTEKKINDKKNEINNLNREVSDAKKDTDDQLKKKEEEIKKNKEEIKKRNDWRNQMANGNQNG